MTKLFTLTLALLAALGAPLAAQTAPTPDTAVAAVVRRFYQSYTAPLDQFEGIILATTTPDFVEFPMARGARAIRKPGDRAGRSRAELIVSMKRNTGNAFTGEPTEIRTTVADSTATATFYLFRNVQLPDGSPPVTVVATASLRRVSGAWLIASIDAILDPKAP